MSFNTIRGPRRDHRLKALLLVALAIAALGVAVQWIPGKGSGETGFPSLRDRNKGPEAEPLPVSSLFPQLPAPRSAVSELGAAPGPDPATDPSGHSDQMREREMRQRLAEARKLLDAGKYGDAVPPLIRAIAITPRHPDPYVSMGYAQLGLGNLAHAAKAFMQAIDLKPNESTAYYGLGMVFEQEGDLEGALGAIRSYLHLAKDVDAFSPAVTRARSAIWEWESRLGRGPWGPTRGIPPGLTQQDVLRDGTGIGMLEPLPDGTSRARKRPVETTGAAAQKE